MLAALFTIAVNYFTYAQNPYQSRYIEKMPVFLGEGNDVFKFITDNLIYPEVAKTVGYQGEVMVGFTIKADGTVADVKALNILGGGCDSEAVRLMSLARPWQPASYNKKPVDAKINVPVDFTLDKKQINTTIAHLKKSPYGFLFFIGGTVYTLDETEAKFGKTYDPTLINDIQKYNSPKHAMPDKSGVYLILMRNSM